MSDILKDFDKKNEVPKVKIPKFATGGICNDAIFPKLDVFSQIDEIVKDIRDRQDNAMAMEFTKCIGELLKNNGVAPKITEARTGVAFDKDRNVIEEIYGVLIEGLDFSEHDKVFEDKIEDLESLMKKQEEFLEMKNIQIAELKQRIAELESKETTDLPFDPLETANYLINATWERETSSLERGILKCPKYVSNNKYGIDELEQIAEHLLIYCKHNKECEE